MYDCMFSQDAKLYSRRTEQTQIKLLVILQPVTSGVTIKLTYRQHAEQFAIVITQCCFIKDHVIRQKLHIQLKVELKCQVTNRYS